MIELKQSTAFELLTFDGVFLLFPQAEVVSSELVDDVHPSADNGSRVITYEGEDYPIFSLNSKLELLKTIPSEHTTCVCCKGADNESRFALSCALAEPFFLGTTDILQEVPEVMSNPKSPIQMLLSHLFQHRQDLALVSTAEKMAAYLMSAEVANE